MIQQTFLAQHAVSQNHYQRSLHFHDVNEILFSLNDNCSFFLKDETYDVHRGMLVLIPEGTIHRKINPPGLAADTYMLHYPVSLLEAYSTPNTDLRRIYGSSAICTHLPERMVDHAVDLFERCLPEPDGSYGNDLRRNLRFLDILLEFYPLLSAEQTERTSQSNIAPMISNALAYINSHLSEKLTLDGIAKALFVSKFNLCRQFKKETGFTIVEYINSSRIRQACTMLREGKMSIADVGASVGFSSQSHFIHTFHLYAGVNPRNYMKNYQMRTGAPMFSSFVSLRKPEE